MTAHAIAGLLLLGAAAAIAANRGRVPLSSLLVVPILDPLGDVLEPVLGEDPFGRPLTWIEANSIIGRLIADHFGHDRVDMGMAMTIASIESDFDPRAFRAEFHLGDASVGLFQTLTRTAKWLYADMGYRAQGEPSLDRLFDPTVSAYFGLAYLDYLANRHPTIAQHGEEQVVRAYNGGPGGAFKAATDGYWRKYQARKRELFGG